MSCRRAEQQKYVAPLANIHYSDTNELIFTREKLLTGGGEERFTLNLLAAVLAR